MTQNKNRKISLFERIKSIADLPGEAGSGFSLQLRGEREMYVCGCRRILEYTPQKIVLALKGFSLVICGECLVCASYFERAVGIEGEIISIALDKGMSI